MATFSVGQSIGAGFSLVARRPLDVLIWGLVIWVVGFLPLIWILSSVMSSMGPLIAASEAATTVGKDTAAGMQNSEQFMQAYMQAIGPLMVFQPLLLVGSLVLRGVLTSAVCRAILEPEDDRLAYLRLGMREVWMVLVVIVMAFIIGFAMFAALIPVAILLGIAAAVIGQSGMNGVGGAVFAIIAVVALIALFCAVIWLSLRLIMGVFMSFDQNQFRLFESWGFTRGHTAKMVVLVLIQVVLVLLAEVILIALIAAIGMSIASTIHLSEQTLRAMFTHPATAWNSQVIALVGLGSLVLAIIGGFLLAIIQAPWVEAYRQLRDSGASGSPAYVPSLGEAQPLA